MDEQKLICAARKGDDSAFETLIENYRAKIYGICLRFLCSEQDAQDAAQDAMIKIYLSIRKYRFQSSFATWVYTLTKNTALDYIRNRRKRSDVSYDELAEQGGSLFVGSDLTSLAAEERQLKEKIAELINALPKEQRLCVILKDVEGYSLDDIAVILKQPQGTIKSRLHRGRSRLQEMIKRSGIEL